MLKQEDSGVTERDLMAVRCGERWPYYRQRFIRAAAGQWIQWNWGAALLPLWGMYWRSTPALLLYCLFPFVAAELTRFVEWHSDLLLGKLGGLLLVGVVSGLLKGLFGTRLLFLKVRGDVRSAVQRAGSAPNAVPLLQKQAPQAGLAGALVHASGTAMMLVLGIFVAGYSLAYPLERNSSYMRGRARAELRVAFDRQLAYRDSLGVWASDVAALGLAPQSELDVTITLRDSATFSLSARATRARAVCRMDGSVGGPSEPEITCGRR